MACGVLKSFKYKVWLWLIHTKDVVRKGQLVSASMSWSWMWYQYTLTEVLLTLIWSTDYRGASGHVQPAVSYDRGEEGDYILIIYWTNDSDVMETNWRQISTTATAAARLVCVMLACHILPTWSYTWSYFQISFFKPAGCKLSWHCSRWWTQATAIQAGLEYAWETSVLFED